MTPISVNERFLKSLAGGLRSWPEANSGGSNSGSDNPTPPTSKVVLSSQGVQTGANVEDTPDVDALYDQPTAVPSDEMPRKSAKKDRAEAGLDSTVSVESDEMDAEVGRDFGEYEILSELGRGAMGIVYKARQKQLRRDVALKVMLVGMHASKKQVARFYKEAQAAAKLRHPNIVPIYDIDRRHGRHFYTMDFIPGKGLNQVISSGEVFIRGALSLVIKIADALQYAHDNKVVHRDVKPSNIIIDMNGEPQLMDFGLAKQLDSGTKFTQTGSALGTPAYMSPEQAAGESHRIDHRSDIYSLGAVLYEMVTGHPPFESDNMMKVIMQVLNHDPMMPRAHNPKIHRDIQTIIMKAMEKNPERRYQSMKEFADELNRFLAGESIHAKPASIFTRGWKKIRKHTTAVASISVACIIAGLSMIAVHISREEVKEVQIQIGKVEDELARTKQEAIDETIPQKVQAVADDFSGEALLPVWVPQSKDHKWRVEEGELVVEAQGESVILLQPSIEIKGNIKFDFVLRLPTEIERFRVDCLIGEDQGQAFRLILQNGDPKPQLQLQRSGAKLAEVDLDGFGPGKTWLCNLERRADQIRFEVREPSSEKPIGILRYKGLELIRSLGASKTGKFLMGFAVWDCAARFDNVTLTKEGAPEKGILYFPEQSILSKTYDISTLSDLMTTHTNELVKYKARYLIGLCYELENQYRDALEHYGGFPQTLAEKASKEDSEEFARLYRENEVHRFFCYVKMGRLEQAAEVVSVLVESGRLIDGAFIWHFRDVLQRCLVTPRLEEALVIINRARFDGHDLIVNGSQPELSMYELSKAISRSTHGEFLEKAIRLAVKFGTGLHPDFSKVVDVYEAFPDPQMSVALEKTLSRAITTEKLDDALTLLKFSRERLPVGEKMEQLATQLADRYCRLKLYASVPKVFESYPTPLLAKSYSVAVQGLLKQGDREGAKSVFLQAREAFATADLKDESLLATIETMGLELMNVYARSGDYSELTEILGAFSRPTTALVTPVETALARAIEKEEFEQAVALLKVVRERSLPATESLIERTRQLADSLAGKQKVVSFISAYNAYPVKQFAGSLLKLLKVCEANDAYASCVELLKFARDKLDAGDFNEINKELDEFLIGFVEAAIKRGEFLEVVATHRAFPTDKLHPVFVKAIFEADKVRKAADELQASSMLPLVKLITYSRQQWPYPVNGELRSQLLTQVSELAELVAAKAGHTVSEAGDSQPTLPEKLLNLFVTDYKTAVTDHAEEPQKVNGLTVELADILMLTRRYDEAKALLDPLAEKLPELHALRDKVLLRIAVLLTNKKEKDTALVAWKKLANEGGDDSPYRRLADYMSGEAIDDAFTGLTDVHLQQLLAALRLKITDASEAEVTAAFTELAKLQKDKLDWYSSIVKDNVGEPEEGTDTAAAPVEAKADTE